tara:strand:+ start:649 stop:852 length:204 start_codon:yes stop_codon:yes gene_type:complete
LIRKVLSGFPSWWHAPSGAGTSLAFPPSQSGGSVSQLNALAVHIDTSLFQVWFAKPQWRYASAFAED